AAHRPLPFAPTQKHRVQQTRSLRLRQKLIPKTDQSARWRLKLEAHAAGPVIHHLRHLSFAPPERLGNHTDELIRTINHDRFDGLERLAFNLPRDRLRLRHLHLVTFAAHHLDENRELQLTASGHLELIGRVSIFNSDRHVAENLLVEPFLELARRDVLSFTTSEWRVVDAEDHRDGGLVDGDRGQRLRVLGRSDRVADVDILDTGERDDLAKARALDRLSLQSFEDVKLRHPCLLHRT